MKVDRHYAINILFLLAGGFLTVAAFAWEPGTLTWLAFAVGIGAVVFGVMHAAVGRNVIQRSTGLLVGLLGAWTIVESLVFGGTTVKWISFADALALATLGLMGLTAHELKTERVVHSLEVAPERERARESVAA